MAVFENFRPFTAWVDNGEPCWYAILRARGHLYAILGSVAYVVHPLADLLRLGSQRLARWYALPRLRGLWYANPRCSVSAFKLELSTRATGAAHAGRATMMWLPAMM